MIFIVLLTLTSQLNVVHSCFFQSPAQAKQLTLTKLDLDAIYDKCGNTTRLEYENKTQEVDDAFEEAKGVGSVKEATSIRTFMFIPEAMRANGVMAFCFQKHLEDLAKKSNSANIAIISYEKDNNFPGSKLDKLCNADVDCDSTSKYRTVDGSCNNLQNKRWGMAGRGTHRLLEPLYDDDWSKPRSKTKDGKPLPNPRIVSMKLITDRDHPANLTLLTSHLGQLVDHDMSFSPATPTKISCCLTDPSDKELTEDRRECIEIRTPESDKFFRSSGCEKMCQEATRTLPAIESVCGNGVGWRQQTNAITAYIDASFVYGNDEKSAKDVRSFENGLLRTAKCQEESFLPFDSSDLTCQSGEKLSFLGGDVRANENPQLTTLQVMFLRLHNLIATKLLEFNPTWDDEILHQESRRIVGAVVQKISYTELMPKIIGNKLSAEHGFDKVCNRGGDYFEDYDPNLPAVILNEFSGAAMRFGHSTLPSTEQMMDENRQIVHEKPVGDILFQPSFILEHEHGIDSLIRGLTSQPCQHAESFFTNQVNQRLFAGPGRKCGADLAAININRGRDHGLHPYNVYRKYYGLGEVTDETEFDHVFGKEGFSYQDVIDTYGSMDELDLYLGVSEIPEDDAFVGPLFGRIISEQLTRTMKGDRFWFENSPTNSPHPFTKEQLASICDTTFAGITCMTTNVTGMQQDAFLKTSRILPCTDPQIKKLDLSPWKPTEEKN